MECKQGCEYFHQIDAVDEIGDTIVYVTLGHVSCIRRESDSETDMLHLTVDLFSGAAIHFRTSPQEFRKFINAYKHYMTYHSQYD